MPLLASDRWPIRSAIPMRPASSAVTVVGTIASLAARLMGTVTEKLTAARFECVRKKIEER
jgi:hypothetical protein